MTEHNENVFIHSNVHIFYKIAQESHTAMTSNLDKHRTPKPDGGFIIKLDPDQKSFKKAFITIVFSGIFLESVLHILIVQRKGVDTYKKYDRKSYEEKLKLLGCNDQRILGQCKHLREVRREIVHEKAYINTDSFLIAQKEADAAIEVVNNIVSYFDLKIKS